MTFVRGNNQIERKPRGMGPKSSRREFLSWSLSATAAGAAGLAAPLVVTRGARAAVSAKSLSFYNIHTGESLKTVFWAEGRFLLDHLSEIDFVLRDFRTGDVREIDPKLLDLLYRLRRSVGSREPYHVISGYRSPKTNEMLRRQGGGGVAKTSYHMKGMAADVFLPGVGLKSLRKAALAMKAGGVGYYPKPGFVHVDTGRVRFW